METLSLKMQDFTHELDKEICDQINPALYDFLMMSFPDVKIFDPVAFEKARGFEASISSIFFFTSGSFDCDWNGKQLYVHNGTIQEYGNCSWDSLSKKYLKLANFVS